MSATTVKLLQAAAEIVGGEEALAGRLGISERMLVRFMNDSRELPDSLLVQAVDIVLSDRYSDKKWDMSINASSAVSGEQ